MVNPVQQKLIYEEIKLSDKKVLTHCPYSADILPSDLQLFRYMEHRLKKTKFRKSYFSSQPTQNRKRGIENFSKSWREVVGIMRNRDYI